MKHNLAWCLVVLGLMRHGAVGFAASGGGTNSVGTQSVAVALFSKPLSLSEALQVAEQHNGPLAQARKEIEAQAGVALQTRVVALPKVRGTGNYQITDQGALESFFPGFPTVNDQSWNVGIQVVQPIYEGGRIQSGLRKSKLVRELSLKNYETTLADTVMAVRVSFADVLMARENIVVQEASVNLLTRELEETRRRFDAGTVPQFNVLRAETELGNARPRLIRARNAHRVAKQNLVNQLGQHLAPGVPEEVPLELVGRLEATEVQVELSQAVVDGLAQRTELAALRLSRSLREEDVAAARAGLLPRADVFAGYGGRSMQFDRNLGNGLAGWQAGAQVSWDIWDGGMTRGRIQESKSRREQAEISLDEATRRVELEVRMAYSTWIEAKELLVSQKKVTETAEEALRLANSRAEAGAATQLDVLNAQTALTETRTTQVQALRDYTVALARLERATGRLVTRAAK